MKKILSFLTKKPLALAAVALFSMSAYADGTAPAATQTIWKKLTDPSLLKPYLKVTLVDEVQGKIYTVNEAGTAQIEAEDFEPGADASENGSFLYVCEGAVSAATPTDDVFSLNTQDDGLGGFINREGVIEFRSYTPETSWKKDITTAIYNERDQLAYLYYDWDPKRQIGGKIFKTTTGRFEDGFVPASLYYEAEVGLPIITPEEGPQEGTSLTVTIENPNEDGKIQYRTIVDGETSDWTDYDAKTGVVVENPEGPFTVEAKIVWTEGDAATTGGEEKVTNETKPVGANYVLYTIETPDITPVEGEPAMNESGELKVNDEGKAEVDITSEDDTTIDYTIDGEEASEPDNEANLDLADQADNTITVTATAKKEITWTPWYAEGTPEDEIPEDVTTPVSSETRTVEYTVTGYPAPKEVVFNTISETGVEREGTVALGEVINVWYEVGQDGYGIAYNGEKEENQTLTLKFGDDETEEIVNVTLDEKTGRAQFTVPANPEYANSYFTFDVPEGFYYTYTGGDLQANKVDAPAEPNVKFFTGLLEDVWIITPETSWLTTDQNTLEVQVYPKNVEDRENAVVELTDEAKARNKKDYETGEELDELDPAYGTTFAKWKNDPMTTVESVEKKEGTPNTFIVTFFNDEGKAEFIEKYLKDDLLGKTGYGVGFPAGTFVSGSVTNAAGLMTHVYFTEAVELTFDPSDWKTCEGSHNITIKVIAKGAVLTGDDAIDYTTPYYTDVKTKEVNPNPSKITIDPEKKVTIKGVDIHGNTVEVTDAVLQPADEEVMEKKNSKDVFSLEFGAFKFQQDDFNLYEVIIEEGTFKAEKSLAPAFTGKLDVMAHPTWFAKVRPYVLEEGKVSTLTLDCMAVLNDGLEDTDDTEKTFEQDVYQWIDPETGKPVDIFVDETAVTKWTLTERSNELVDADGKITGIVGGKYETFVVTLELAEPITEYDTYKVVINKRAFVANYCDNKKMTLTAYPKVNYGINWVKYLISTKVAAVTYELYAETPDGTRLDKPVKYIGVTEDMTEENAVAFNDAVTPTESGWKYPGVEAAETTSQDVKKKAVTKYTTNFAEGTLVQGNYKMNFPAGTLQVEGYNPSEEDLACPFDVVDALEFDATSNKDHYNDPATKPKDNEYSIGTDVTQIPLYLTGLDLWAKENGRNANANKSIMLQEGTILGFDGKAELEWENVKDGIFTVTFLGEDKDGDGEPDPTGLEPGVYKMIVPAHKVWDKYAYNVYTSTEFDDLGGVTTIPGDIYLNNPEPFELTIYVEDFDDIDDEVEITTKQFAFEVPIEALTEVTEGATASFDDGTSATLSKVEDGVMLVTIGGAKPLVKGVEHNFLHSGDYTLTIPADAYTGQHTTNYKEVNVPVKVIFEFVDSSCEGLEDVPEDYKYRDLTTSTKAEVDAEADEPDKKHEKIYYTRNFANTNLQGLVVPFMIEPDEVSDDYFDLYKIDFIYATDTKTRLNWVSVTDYSVANKPYIMKPKAELGLKSIALEDKVVFEAASASVDCSSTTLKFTVNSAYEKTSVTDAWTLSQGEIRKATVDIPAWRWWLTSEDRGIVYIKIAINGVDVDDATGIDFVEAAEGDTQIFNVAGQRLNAAAKGKVNIINGKKVLVK